jgi:hypothetical protein
MKILFQPVGRAVPRPLMIENKPFNFIITARTE